ncbi:hypothetical protein DNU06_15855 [Putridiphycobacter roseus]|uniref:histidine kinase n=1 Tax=Putridiphycobacter roseus TaxID=2219161 RepID=A0A2W1MWS5_9FLAO|nr:ATP-binding protein [Putridiphycobacter roseus]PZE15854.1 hypothetical protein DNU06_15855 [Putridiphycobacter roseus]
MFGLKGKTLLFFILATILLSVVGGYFYVRLKHLNSTIESRFEPKQQSNLIDRLTLDINKLNNQFLNDTVALSEQLIDSIIIDITNNIETIQANSVQSKFRQFSSLDSIPKILVALKHKNFQLKALRKAGEKKFMSSIDEIIREDLKNKTLTEKDSIIITRQITSYIKKNEIEAADSDSKLTENNNKDLHFFRRIFGAKKRSQNEDDVQKPTTTFEMDTTTQQVVDTLDQSNNDPSVESIDILLLFEKIQMRRIGYIQNIQNIEREIYALNFGINQKTESIIQDFILEQYSSYEDYLAELKAETARITNYLILTILGFTIFTIFLIYRVFKDINRSIMYQRTLELKEKQAKRESEEKQRFLHTMSHEIRTPLTSIIGYIDLLEGESKNIKALKASANYLYQMTNEILDIAKINVGVIEIKKANADLSRSLQELKETFIPYIENKGLQYKFDLPTTPLVVLTDVNRIQQILYNLIHNAIKFTDKGFVNLTLKNEEKAGHYALEFTVEDSGIGMSEEEQKDVFNDFHQVSTHHDKTQGTGLGLGIVKKLVTQMSGELKVSSKINQGAKFIFSLNLEKGVLEKNEPTHAAPYLKSNYQNILQNKSILVIDDDVLITALYEKFLLPTGAKIELYNNPKKALDAINNKVFDLIIVDYKMPEMNGYEFLKACKTRLNPFPKSMVCSANVMLDKIDKENMAAFDAAMFKPIKRTVFLNQIALLLDIELNPTLVDTPEQSFIHFSSLRNYMDNDTDDLIEILETIVAENDKSLFELDKAIKNTDKESIDFIIHKLSSRFSQVDQTFQKNTKEIEKQLRNTDINLAMEGVKNLNTFWMDANQRIKEQLEILKGQNNPKP